MRKAGVLSVIAGAVVLTSVFFVQTDTAVGRVQYKKQFETVYPDVKANNKVTCNACHVGTKKQDRNEYGKALANALKEVTGEDVPKTGVKDADKIKESLEKVAKEEKKFGDRLKEGKLPVDE